MSRSTIKGYRFKNLISNLDIALEKEFYLESISITYAIIEERLRSVLIKIHNPNLGKKHKIDSCLKKLEILTNSDLLIEKHFTQELLDSIIDWKNIRNVVMHELATEGLAYSEIVPCAKSGRELLSILTATIMRWKKEWKKSG